MRLSNRLPPELDEVFDRLGTRRKLPMVEAMGVLSELDSALERIAGHRDAVIALHQQVMKKVSPSISEQSGTYEERQLAHAMMSHPRRPLDLDAFSQGLRIQSMHAEEMMDPLRERRMRDFAANQGRRVAAREGTPLPWWLAR